MLLRKQMKRWAVLFFFVTVGLVGVVTSGKVYAYTAKAWCGNWAGSYCAGYFDGGNASGKNGGDLISGGVSSTSASAFISKVNGELGNGGRDRMGASMIIDEMMNYGHNRRDQSGSPEQDWAKLVRDYENAPSGSGYGVDWTKRISAPNRDSAYASDINDDVYHVDQNGGTISVIYFYWPGGSFAINRACANLVGSAPPLKVVPDFWTLTSATRLDGADADKTVDINTGVTFKHKVTNKGPDTAQYNWQVQGYYEHNGAAYDWSNNRTPGLGQASALPSGNSGRVGSGSESPTYDSTANVFRFPANSSNGDRYCEKIIYNFGAGPGTANDQSYRHCVTVSVPPTPPSGTCNIGIIPVEVEFGESATVKITLVFKDMVSTPTPVMKYIVDSGSPVVLANPAPSISGGTYTYNYNVPYTPSSPGTHTVQGVYSGGAPVPTGCASPVSVRASAHPYVKVFGGDVEAGNGPAVDNSCTNPTAGIKTWNSDVVGEYKGAGTQFGAEALGIIEGFASAQYNSGANPTKGYGLSLANTNNNIGGDNFGGNYGSSYSCQDYSKDLTPTATTNQTITGASVPANTHNVVYVKGANVFISGNITYGTSSYTVNQIPSYKLVVTGGNIYIGAGVTQLDGLYVAEKANGAGGNIYTCATAMGVPASPLLPTMATSPFYTTCKNQLKVYGSFVAKKVYLLRTNGTTKSAGLMATDDSQAAEQFFYTPEQWLGQSGGGSVGSPDAIISLPPAL